MYRLYPKLLMISKLKKILMNHFVSMQYNTYKLKSQLFYADLSNLNTRAQRALGRSPEEKVKGYSRAIYRGPPNIGKYWWRTSRWCYQICKLWALWFQTRRFLKIAFWKPIFWHRDLLMQPIRTIWKILVGDNPGIIPDEFHQTHSEFLLAI